MNEDLIQEMDLTAQEAAFCDLYVHGGIEFAGQTLKCYREIYGGTESVRDSMTARNLLLRPHMMARIKEMMSSGQYEMEAAAVKLQVAETLKAVMTEAATQNYTDRFGAPLSPASLRAVSVNAAKALMDLYPIKHAQESKLRIESNDGNIIFNVIVPQTTPTYAKEEDR